MKAPAQPLKAWTPGWLTLDKAEEPIIAIEYISTHDNSEYVARIRRNGTMEEEQGWENVHSLRGDALNEVIRRLTRERNSNLSEIDNIDRLIAALLSCPAPARG